MIAHAREIPRQVARGSVPLRRCLREAPVDDPPDRRRDRRIELPDWRRIIANDGRQRFDRGRSVERSSSSEHLVEDEAERELIGAVVRRAAARLLGGHVADRAHDASRPRALLRHGLQRRTRIAIADELGQSEVEDLGKTVVETIRFSGLRSRCTIPASWAFASPSAIGAATCNARRGCIGPASSICRSVWPSTSSMLM